MNQPQWLYALNGGSDGNDYGYTLVVDNTDNIYIAGTIGGSTITFNSADGNLTTITNTNSNTVFIGKMDVFGVWEWITTIDTNINFNEQRLCLNKDNDNNIYLSGIFVNNCIFTSVDSSQSVLLGLVGVTCFLSKINSSGNWIWQTAIGNNSAFYPISSFGLCSDNSNNIYLCGYFSSENLIFNNITIGNLILNGPFTPLTFKGFIAKLNNLGNWDWAYPFISDSNIPLDGVINYDLKITNNDLYVIGSYIGSTITFDDLSLVDTLYQEGGFITKMNISGNILNITNMSSIKGKFYSIDIDPLNNIYVSGVFSETTAQFNNFNFGSLLITSGTGSSSDKNMFIAKLFNNQWIWASVIQTNVNFANSEMYNRIRVCYPNEIYMIGSFPTNGKFQNVPNSVSITVTGNINSYSMFVSKISNIGEWKYVMIVNDTDFNNQFNLYQKDIDIDSLGRIYITGNIINTATFLNTDGTISKTVTSYGLADMIIARINEPPLQVVLLINTEDNIMTFFINDNLTNCQSFPSDDSHANTLFGLITAGKSIISYNLIESTPINYSVNPLNTDLKNIPKNYTFIGNLFATCLENSPLLYLKREISSIIFNLFDPTSTNTLIWNLINIEINSTDFVNPLVSVLSNNLCGLNYLSTTYDQTRYIPFSTLITLSDISIKFNSSLPFGASISKSFCCILPNAKVKVDNSIGYKFIQNLCKNDIAFDINNNKIKILNNIRIKMNNSIKTGFITIKKNSIGKYIPSSDLSLTWDHPILLPNNNNEYMVQDIVNNKDIIMLEDYLTETYLPITEHRTFIIINNLPVGTFSYRDFKDFCYKLKIQGKPISIDYL